MTKFKYEVRDEEMEIIGTIEQDGEMVGKLRRIVSNTGVNLDLYVTYTAFPGFDSPFYMVSYDAAGLLLDDGAESFTPHDDHTADGYWIERFPVKNHFYDLVPFEPTADPQYHYYSGSVHLAEPIDVKAGDMISVEWDSKGCKTRVIPNEEDKTVSSMDELNEFASKNPWMDFTEIRNDRPRAEPVTTNIVHNIDVKPMPMGKELDNMIQRVVGDKATRICEIIEKALAGPVLTKADHAAAIAAAVGSAKYGVGNGQKTNPEPAAPAVELEELF